MESRGFEITLLDVDSQDFISKLISLGAKNKGEFFQRKFVYDIKNKEVILTSDGISSTISISDNANELINTRVFDFDKTNEIFGSLGFISKSYKENYKRCYSLNNVSINIYSSPLMPDYVEIGGSSESEVKNTLTSLGIKSDMKYLDTYSIYKDIYGIDINDISELKFDETILESN